MKSAEPFDIDLDGFRISGLHWRGDADLPTLAMHGWLDNAASFIPIAPLLPELDLWAIDMPGHGLTDHRPVHSSYNIWDDLLDILALADALGWSRFNLLAHSRGAIIAHLLAATMPERIGKVLLVDGIWPMAADAKESPVLLRQYLLDQRSDKARRSLVHPSLDHAIKARAKATAFSQDAARLIVERGVEILEQGKVRWRNDPRLLLSSAFKLTLEHVHAFLAAQSVPIKILLASDGFARYPGVEDMLAQYPHILWQVFEGGHHMHMEQPECMAPSINQFFNEGEGQAAGPVSG